MLHQLPVLTTQEILHLFIQESKRFIIGIEKGMPYNQLNEIHLTLKGITEELDKRSKDGQIRYN